MGSSLVVRSTQNPIADAWDAGIVSAAKKCAAAGVTVCIPHPHTGLLLGLCVEVVMQTRESGHIAYGNGDDGNPYALYLN